MYKQVIRFLKNQSGEFAMQSAIMFGALAIVGALVAAPLLDKASRQYAQTQSLGVDPITTASTGQRTGKTKTYTVRKSVLSPAEEVICRTPSGLGC